jgi:dolichyl-phosphate-mannose-protein mannosyltransferase
VSADEESQTSAPRENAGSAEAPIEPCDSQNALDRIARAVNRLPPANMHLWVLWLLMLATVLLRLQWLDRPEDALIFDEKYYVNASRVILGLPPGQDTYQNSPAGLDPNTEHPPLAKLLVAGSMRLLGDNPYGWRLPSVVFGSLAVLFSYGVARRLSAGTWTAVLAATLLSFDNLVFVHGRIFTLDIFQVSFMLLGLYWYLDRRPLLSGLGFALAALCKIGGIFGLGALVVYELMLLGRMHPGWRSGLRLTVGRMARTLLTFAVVFLVLLTLMDRRWVAYSNPFEHVQRIFSYGVALRRPSGPSGIESYPWQWLWNDIEIPYLKVEQQVKVNNETVENRPLILFRGAMNPYVLHLLPIGITFGLWAWWRRRKGGQLGAMAFAWLVATYLPFFAASIYGQRISYIFYFLPSLPAVTLAGSYFLMEVGLPRVVLWVYLAFVLLGFYGYFPFRASA